MLAELNISRLNYIGRLKEVAACAPGTVVTVCFGRENSPSNRTITEADIERAGRTIENLTPPYDNLFCDMVRRRIKESADKREKRKARKPRSDYIAKPKA